MRVRQISVFMEDRVGRLAEITRILGEAGINIRGFDLADTAEGYGIFRIITSDPDKTIEVLRERGFTVSENDVICVDVPDKPGGLSQVLSILSQAGVNVEYVYAIVKSHIVFHVDKMEEAVRALEQEGIRTLRGKEVYGL